MVSRAAASVLRRSPENRSPKLRNLSAGVRGWGYNKRQGGSAISAERCLWRHPVADRHRFGARTVLQMSCWGTNKSERTRKNSSHVVENLRPRLYRVFDYWIDGESSFLRAMWLHISVIGMSSNSQTVVFPVVGKAVRSATSISMLEEPAFQRASPQRPWLNPAFGLSKEKRG